MYLIVHAYFKGFLVLDRAESLLELNVNSEPLP